MSNLRGKAQSVLGIVERDGLGVVLPHDHLLSDFTCIFNEPREKKLIGLAYQQLTLAKLILREAAKGNF